jgi:hypothetical protein
MQLTSRHDRRMPIGLSVRFEERAVPVIRNQDNNWSVVPGDDRVGALLEGGVDAFAKLHAGLTHAEGHGFWFVHCSSVHHAKSVQL